MNDHQMNLLYVLGTLLVGMLIATALFAVSMAQAATVSIDQYNHKKLESPYDSKSYQFSLNREFIPLERSTLIDNMLRTRQNCPEYVALLERFVSCSPDEIDSGLVSDSNVGSHVIEQTS